ncbi:class F sortase [Kibdelosporangium phytohabitans]|uniref:Peptidase C60 n=1 Tax=Kibdelosporangium phytohabitans TaxID=860235 RepID=A0A0N9IFS3_9PSEU|nr:class F sortase [Kibdelosporangium phytohabitans]ALG13666.1 peptidase C60 [Kibdelosporangium phytohabitans]MBE1465552.1 sortase (surface protein transpeptidase) [Kibdelosporangium phytohabitans]
MRKWLGGAVVALALVLGACSGEQAAAPRPAENTSVAPPQADQADQREQTALSASTPTEVSIPKIGAHSTLVPLGLNPDETVQVPPVTQPMQAGWYDKAPTPGEIGPAVILGHVDGDHKPGIFYKLKEMAAGDEIFVSRSDGTKVRFVADRVKQVSKDAFPTDEVYGDTTKPELRLITCGGVFDKGARSYKDNIIVFATMQPAGR